jgi:hypothetical protein
MPNVTLQMYDWYLHWRKADKDDNLRYAIWFPGQHLVNTDSDWILEDAGYGICDVFIKKLFSKESFLVDPELCTEENGFLRIGGFNGIVKTTITSSIEQPLNMALLHYLRKHGQGLELHSRFWLGLEVVDGKTVNRLRHKQEVTLEMARCWCEHSAWEMATLAAYLPEIYEENK